MNFSHFVLDIVGELLYNTPVMIHEFKEFLNGQLTKSVTATIIHSEEENKEIAYILSNGAVEMRFNVVSTVRDGEFNTFMMVYSRPTEQTLEIRSTSNTDWSFYQNFTNLKDIKEILNTIKTKFFPNL